MLAVPVSFREQKQSFTLIEVVTTMSVGGWWWGCHHRVVNPELNILPVIVR